MSVSKAEKAFGRICDEIDKDPSRNSVQIAHALGISTNVLRVTLWKYGQTFTNLKTKRIEHLVKFYERHRGFVDARRLEEQG